MNPYQELNINEQATLNEIKKAFHKQAKKNHPDKKGNAEKMKTLNQAYAILKNPDSKEKFDRFGETDNPVDNEASQVMTIVMQVVDGIIEKDPSNVDVFLKALQNTWQSNFDNVVHGQKGLKAKLKEFNKRILAHPENDFIGVAIAGRMADVDRMIKSQEAEFNRREKAIAILKEYKFNVKGENNMSFNPGFYTTA